MLHTFLVYKFLVKHRSCGTLLEFLLARLDPPSNLHGSRHKCWGRASAAC